MTRTHRLDIAVSPGDLAFVLVCPYDRNDLDSYPDWMVPPCRAGRDPHCQAATAVAFGQLPDLWGGPTTILTSGMHLHLWRDDNGLHLAPVTVDTRTETPVPAPPPPPEPPPATPEDLARELAQLCRSPRYAGEQWKMLLDATSNVDHAWREAVRHDADQNRADALRAALLAYHWHRNARTADTADEDKVARH